MKALVYHGPGERHGSPSPTRRSRSRRTSSSRSTRRRSAAPTCTSSRATCPRSSPARSSATRPSARSSRPASAVTTLAEGDRVLVSCITSCGRCRFCKEAHYGLCTGGGGWIFGHLIDGAPGRVRARAVRRHVGLQGARRADRRAGAVPRRHPPDGLRGRRAERRRPAGRHRRDRRRGPDRARHDHDGEAVHARAGSSRSTSPTRGSRRRSSSAPTSRSTTAREDAVARVMELTGGLGADVAIEAVGVPETFELCAELVRPGGRVANVGVHGHPATLHLEKLWIRDVTDHDRSRRHVHDAAAAEADRRGPARPDAVRDAPVRARRGDGGVRRLRRRRATNALKVVLECAARAAARLRAAAAAAAACSNRGAWSPAPPTSSSGTADASAAAARGGRTRTPCSSSSRGSPSAASTCASTASPELDEQPRRALRSSPTGTSAARCWRRSPTRTARAVVAVANYVRLRDPDTRRGRVRGGRRTSAPRHRHAPARAARRRAPAESGSSGSSPRCCPTTERCSASSRPSASSSTRELEGGELEVRFPIAPTETLRARVDERDHVAVTASLRPFFEPRSVAVIGASRRRGSIGGELFRNILAGDFAGAAYPVNRDGEPVAGVRGYRSIEEIPDDRRPRGDLPAGRGACSRRRTRRSRTGVRALCVISAGFAETGSEGAERQERAARARPRARRPADRARTASGSRSPAPSLNATFAPRGAPAGQHRLLVAERRARRSRCSRAAESRGLGLSAFVSIGNKADVSSNDLLEWWEDDAGDRARAAVPRVVRQPAPVRRASRGASRAGSRSSP